MLTICLQLRQAVEDRLLPQAHRALRHPRVGPHRPDGAAQDAPFRRPRGGHPQGGGRGCRCQPAAPRLSERVYLLYQEQVEGHLALVRTRDFAVMCCFKCDQLTPHAVRFFGDLACYILEYWDITGNRPINMPCCTSDLALIGDKGLQGGYETVGLAIASYEESI
jgi:hypothetical protein